MPSTLGSSALRRRGGALLSDDLRGRCRPSRARTRIRKCRCILTRSLITCDASMRRLAWRGRADARPRPKSSRRSMPNFLSAPTTRSIRRCRTSSRGRRCRWLHIAGVVAAEAVRRGFRRIGLTGTRWLVESEVYPDRLSARVWSTCVQTAMNAKRSIASSWTSWSMAIFKPEAIAISQRVIRRMKDEGCDAVILGCTEIPLLMNDANSPLPTLDSTRLLARAALRRAVGR